MKKIAIICLLVMQLFCLFSVSAVNTEVDSSIVSGCNTVDGLLPFLGSQQLVKNAKAAFMYETNTDTLMYANNADEKLPPASLLKMLTALIAIEKGNMTDAVTVQESVLATLDRDAAVVGLEIDEVVTVKDLLYCMMVSSGNDAAVILADHIMGSQEAFVAEMNRYAAELGCTNTNFTNVHGLHDPDQFTTARDVARILIKAIQNEMFCDVFGAKYYSVPATNKSDARHLSSQNYLINNDKVVIHYDERVTGSRTAVANDLSRSIASVAQVDDMKLVCVVMGAESVYEKDGYTIRVFGGYDETKKLFDLGFAGHKTTQILHPNQVILQKSVLDGSSDVYIGTKTGVFSVIPDNINADNLTYRYVNEATITAPIEKGQKVSTLQIWHGTVCLAQADLYAMNNVVPASTLFSDNSTVGGQFNIVKTFLWLLAGIVVIVLVMFISLSILRATRIAKARRQSRRNSRNRRRSR